MLPSLTEKEAVTLKEIEGVVHCPQSLFFVLIFGKFVFKGELRMYLILLAMDPCFPVMKTQCLNQCKPKKTFLIRTQEYLMELNSPKGGQA